MAFKFYKAIYTITPSVGGTSFNSDIVLNPGFKLLGYVNSLPTAVLARTDNNWANYATDNVGGYLIGDINARISGDIVNKKIQFYTNNIEQLEISGTSITIKNSDLIIPKNKEIKIINNSDTVRTFVKQDTSNNLEFWNVNGNFIFRNHATIASSNIRVGINTNTPDEALHVIGNMKISGNAVIQGTTFTTEASTVEIADNIIVLNKNEVGAGVTAVTSGIEIERGTLTNFQFIFDEATDTGRIGLSGATDALATREDTPSARGIAHWDATTKRFITNANVVVDTSGNIGIGTSSPNSKLQINFDSGIALTGTTAYGGLHFKQLGPNDDFVGITFDGTSSGTQGGILFQGSGSYGSKIHFLTTSSYAVGMQQRMIIDHLGNIGIGTLTPDTLLHIGGTSGSPRISIGESGAGRKVLDLAYDFTLDLSIIRSLDLANIYKDLVFYNRDFTVYSDPGTGTAVESFKISKDKNVSIGGSLLWGSGQTINSSDLVMTFPYNKLVNHWNNGTQVFRYYVNGDTGNDNNNGSKLSLGFRQIQKAIDALPSNLNGYTAFILVTGGSYSPVDMSRLYNGTVTFEWIGTDVNLNNSAFKTWTLQGETVPNNTYAEIISTDTSSAFKYNKASLPLLVNFFAYERLDTADEPWSKNYGMRWRFTATGQSSRLFMFFSSESHLVIPQCQFNLGMAYAGVGIDSNFEIYNVKFIGGAGIASTEYTDYWGWRSPLTLLGMGNQKQTVLGAWMGYKDNPMPLSSYLYFEDVKEAINTGRRPNPALDMSRCYEGSNKLRYVKVNSAFVKSKIVIDSNFRGAAAYNSNEFDFSDTSKVQHRVLNTATNTWTTITSGMLADNDSKLTLGGSDLSLAAQVSIINATTSNNALLIKAANSQVADIFKVIDFASSSLFSIANTGSVNISGTAANGGARLVLTTTDSTANSAIVWKDNLGATKAFIGSNYNVSEAGNLEIGTGGTTTRMIIGAGGDIGVGVTSAGPKLHIGKADAEILRVERLSSSANAVVSLMNTAGISYFGRPLNNFFAIGPSLDLSNSPYLCIDSTGKIGIGTTAPNAKLEIAGGTSSDQLRIGAGATNYYKIGRNNTSGFLDFQGTQAGYTGYSFKNDDGSTHLTILDSGDVLIAGELYATAKHFKVRNKLDKTKAIVYTSVEANENLVLIRGNVKSDDNSCEIRLPQEWEWLVDPESISVFLTAEGEDQKLVYSKAIDRVSVTNKNRIFNKGLKFSYLIVAERCDVQKLEVNREWQ